MTQLDPSAVAAFLSYYRGRRTVVWSAFATAAPQRSVQELGVPVLIGGPGRRLGELLAMARVFSQT